MSNEAARFDFVEGLTLAASSRGLSTDDAGTIDFLIAAARCTTLLGNALIRLRGEFDALQLPRRPARRDKVAEALYERQLRAQYDKLTSLNTARPVIFRHKGASDFRHIDASRKESNGHQLVADFAFI